MEKNWYYSADGQDKKGPMPESELKQLLASGQIPAGTLVWSEGMANWAPSSSVAALQQQAAAVTPAGVAPVAAAPLAGGAQVPQGLGSWMTFVGVMNIIGGAFACLSCIYILYGVPLIISGAALLGAKGLLNALPSVDATMLPFLEKMRFAFKAAGWAYILMFISVIIFLIVYGVFIAAFISKMAPNMH
ncbi:MAG: DUF5362 family protein [Kiritimatiellaeota bacterium]|nr:DUF5362 family protein [Kiritimatiellota bacterium]